MTTAKPASQPFTFDRAFDREAPGTTPRPVQRKMLTLDEIETLKRDAFAAGQRVGEQGHGKQQADALAAIAEQIGALGQALESALQPARCDAVSLGYVTALKLARIALAKFPEDEIKALIARCIEEQKTEPHLVLRVNNALLEPLREAAKGLAELSAFGGRIHVIGEPQIATGDCQIEWADGGLTRNLDGALTQIEAVIRNYVFCADGEPEKVPSPEKIMALSEETQLSIEGVLIMAGGDGVELNELMDGTARAEEGASSVATAHVETDDVDRTATELTAVFDVPVHVSAILGKAHMDVSQLLKLGRGAVVELDRKVGEAIDIYVNNRLVARGEVVLVEDRLGVTMTEIIKGGQS